MKALLKTCIALLIGVNTVSFAAIKYEAPMDATSNKLWSVTSSKISCDLSYVILDYGIASFFMDSGSERKVSFELRPSVPIATNSNMRIIKATPSWRTDGREELLGTIKLYSGFSPFLGDTVSWRMLNALDNGYEILMPYTDTRISRSQSIVPVLSPLGFDKKYREFVNCQNGLIDIGYRDVQITIASFDASSDVITLNTEIELNRLIKYINSDESVIAVNISSFTYGEGSNEKNEELDKKRRAALTEYFSSRGVKEDLLKFTSYTKENQSISSGRLEAQSLDSRKVMITLSRDLHKIRYSSEIDMPDVGVESPK